MKRFSVRYTIYLAITGVVTTLLVWYVNQSIQSTYRKNLPYVTLGDNVKTKTTKGHLWFEELMAGDQSIDFEKDIVLLFDISRVLLYDAYEGKQNALGKFSITEEETNALIKEAMIGVENLTAAARQRWEFKQHSSISQTDSTAVDTGEGAGGKLDQQFDATFEGLQTTLDKLVTHVDKKVQDDMAFLNVLSLILLLLIFAIFLALCFFVYRLLRGNEKLVTAGEQRLNDETKRVEKLSSFIESVSTGNYAIEIDSTDELSNKLITMRDTLRTNAEEDQRRNWATSGLAQIGEILRSSDNTKELYDNIIKFVVKYVNSNQGGLFLLNDDNEQDQYLELVSCYAFERKKFIVKRVDLGQGLVGQCYLEGARIHLRKIPDGYVHITSGLGGTNPNSLLVIPMKVNDKTYGVIELASFRKFEEHEIVLVEKFAENIGAAVSSVKINESTRILLEKTQQQAEEMRSQEEEMRQNMEELSATQEEMLRKEREYINRIQELEERASATAHT
jgi:putative methionine-R-sulfoxide reductase with GAF domain